MARWFSLDPVAEGFFDDAPHVLRYSYDLDVPAERVWASLVSDNSVADWTPLLASIAWTSPRPLGEGSTRTVVLPGRALTMHEYFFAWHEGRRFSFYVTEANRPLFQSFAEDYLVEPTATGCRFTWTFALSGTPRTRLLLSALAPVNAVQFRQMSAGCKQYFAKHPGS